MVDYDALRQCLAVTLHRAAAWDYEVHIPAGIGSGLARGDKSIIHQIIREEAESAGCEVVLWEFDDKSAASFVSSKSTVSDTSIGLDDIPYT